MSRFVLKKPKKTLSSGDRRCQWIWWKETSCSRTWLPRINLLLELHFKGSGESRRESSSSSCGLWCTRFFGLQWIMFCLERLSKDVGSISRETYSTNYQKDCIQKPLKWWERCIAPSQELMLAQLWRVSGKPSLRSTKKPSGCWRKTGMSLRLSSIFLLSIGSRWDPKPYRIDLCYSQIKNQSDQGCWECKNRFYNGIQADTGSWKAVMSTERIPRYRTVTIRSWTQRWNCGTQSFSPGFRLRLIHNNLR